MEDEITSIIITRHSNHGYVASLRFKDKSKDVELSSEGKYSIYTQIESYVKLKPHNAWRIGK